MTASSQPEKRVLFCIADHLIEVFIPESFERKRLLPAFQPFRCDFPDNREVICSIRVAENPIDIAQDSLVMLQEDTGIMGYWYCLMETEHNYVVDIQFVENGNCYRMVTDKFFSNATVYLDGGDENATIILSSFLMISFAQSAVLHKTFLMHASVVEKDGKGFAFLGKSGMGKSTHSSLWIRYVEGVELLNDDNPAVRIDENGSVKVYGTPWSGKTPCYKNRNVKLEALIRLEKATVNQFTWKKGKDALITLLPSCTSMRWNDKLYTELCNLLEEIIGNVKIGYLKCMPDKDAALLCYAEIKKSCKFAAK